MSAGYLIFVRNSGQSELETKTWGTTGVEASGAHMHPGRRCAQEEVHADSTQNLIIQLSAHHQLISQTVIHPNILHLVKTVPLQ